MPTGKVSFFDEVRGFGFIVRDDGGTDVFCHVHHLANADMLRRDQRVSFEVVLDERRNKPRADNVRVLDDAALARTWPVT
jgi:cold shock protein